MTSEGVMIWVLAGTCSVLATISGYLLVRHFTMKDKQGEDLSKEIKSLAERMDAATNEWSKAAAGVNLLVEQTRNWAMDKFVTDKDCTQKMRWCKESCPYHMQALAANSMETPNEDR